MAHWPSRTLAYSPQIAQLVVRCTFKEVTLSADSVGHNRIPPPVAISQTRPLVAENRACATRARAHK